MLTNTERLLSGGPVPGGDLGDVTRRALEKLRLLVTLDVPPWSSANSGWTLECPFETMRQRVAQGTEAMYRKGLVGMNHEELHLLIDKSRGIGICC